MEQLEGPSISLTQCEEEIIARGDDKILSLGTPETQRETVTLTTCKYDNIFQFIYNILFNNGYIVTQIEIDTETPDG
jgi:hypothetical protein